MSCHQINYLFLSYRSAALIPQLACEWSTGTINYYSMNAGVDHQRQEPQQQEIQSPDLAAGPPPVPKTRGTLTLAFGRFNPPHAGHQQLMDIAAQSAEAEESDYIIVPSYNITPY